MSEQPPTDPFKWSDLPELGISEFTLRRWLRSGVVRRPLTGVYCSATAEDSLEHRARCAALVLPEDAVVCDRSAAWLWGVDVHEPDERFAVPDLEVAVRPGHTPPHRKAVRGVERELVEDEVIQVHGVKVTTPVRTALDVACLRGRWRALATLDAFMREHELTHEDFGTAAVRLSGRRGVTQARELYPLASSLPESQGESWVRGAIHDAGLLMPEPQVEIWEDGALVARIDLAYRRLRIAVEYDGEEFHGEEQAEHDEARRDWLRERGWYVIVVRKHQLAVRAREQWLDELGAIIAARSAPQKRKYARSRVPWVPAQ